MRLLLKWLAVSAVIALSPRFSTDIYVAGFSSAVWVAFVYGVLFVAIGWLIRLMITIFSIVPGILTLGLFFLLVPIISNTILLKLTSGMLGRFEVRTWSAALVLSIVIAVVGLFFEGKNKDEDDD